jgi:hypothetical protein
MARIEDLRAVDRPDQILAEVRPVDLEEVLEQVPVGEPLRVEDDFDHLGVAPGILLARVVTLAATAARSSTASSRRSTSPPAACFSSGTA